MSNPGKLLAAVRELRSALEHPISYPDRPKKTRADLSDDRTEAIRAVFYGAVHHTPDELPLGIEMKLSDLLNDLANLQVRPIEEPNGLHRRALNMIREIETTLVAFGMNCIRGESNRPTTALADNVAEKNSEGEKPAAGPSYDAPVRTAKPSMK